MVKLRETGRQVGRRKNGLITSKKIVQVGLTVVEANRLARDRSRWRIAIGLQYRAASARRLHLRRQGLKSTKSN